MKFRWAFILNLSLCCWLFSFAAAAKDLPDFIPIIDKAGVAVVNVITVNNEAKKLVPDELRGELEGTPLMDVLKQLYGDKLEEKLSGKGPSLGSGCIISSDGYVVTNYHVIEGANKIYVRLHDRREFLAKVIGFDSSTDLALLKVDAASLPFLPFADSDQVKVGEWVLTIGSPFGFENTVTAGVVSAVNRSLGEERYVPFIQTDAAINPGNSGGPLLNLKGEMVGINSQIVSESGGFAGLSFAIPSNVVKAVINQIKLSGSVVRGWLGLGFQELNLDLADSFGLNNLRGALVSKVLDNSPGAKGGIKEGDIITKFNGKEIMKATDLPPMIGLLPVNSKVSVTVVRAQHELNVNLVLSQHVQLSDPTGSNNQSVATSMDKLHEGITVRELENFERAAMGSNQHGVIVINVANKYWSLAGVRKGDIIMSVNNQFTPDIKSFYTAINDLTSTHAFPVLVTHSGEIQHYVAVKLGD